MLAVQAVASPWMIQSTLLTINTKAALAVPKRRGGMYLGGLPILVGETAKGGIIFSRTVRNVVPGSQPRILLLPAST